MKSLTGVIFALSILMMIGSGIYQFHHSKALGRCMAQGYVKAEVTMAGTFCRKWTAREGEIVVPLI